MKPDPRLSEAFEIRPDGTLLYDGRVAYSPRKRWASPTIDLPMLDGDLYLFWKDVRKVVQFFNVEAERRPGARSGRVFLVDIFPITKPHHLTTVQAFARKFEDIAWTHVLDEGEIAVLEIDVESPEHAAEVERFWGTLPEGSIYSRQRYSRY